MSESIRKFKRLSARLRGTAAEEIPGRFEIKCDCGCQVTGVRSSSWQQPSCPQCHLALFLLPTNVYPSTGSVENDVIGGAFGHRLRVVAGEMFLRGRPSGQKPTRERSADGPAAEKFSQSEENSGSNTAEPRRRPPKISLAKVNPKKIVRSTFTPFRLLLMGMILVVGGTSFWTYNRAQHEIARTTWHESTDAIAALIENGEFEDLEETLSRATEAGRRIGMDGREWRHVLNLLEETQAVTSICYVTLPSLLSEVSERQLLDDRELQSLKTELMSGTFVIDGYIDPLGRGTGSYVLDIPAMSGRHPVSVTMQLPQLDDYMTQNAPHRFVFAFRLASVSPPRNTQQDAWKMCVAPESFVLLTSEEHCHYLGFSVDSEPALAELLVSQRTFIQESDRWARRREELAEQQVGERESHQ